MIIGEVSTVFSCSFTCECGGTVAAQGEIPTPVHILMVTISGVKCDGCDATYTVEIATKETTND